jgi:hypothetical protein
MFGGGVSRCSFECGVSGRNGMFERGRKRQSHAAVQNAKRFRDVISRASVSVRRALERGK